MRRLASILALLAVPALAQIPITTADNWQSIVQTAAPSSWFAFAAGTYTTTGTSVNITSGWTRIESANGPANTFIVAGSYSNSGCITVTATNVTISGFTIAGGYSTNDGGGVRGHGLTMVTNCRIVSNTTVKAVAGGSEGGGGLWGCTAYNSVISFNVATNALGGGMFFNHATAVAHSCLVESNRASSASDGGGIAARWNNRAGSILNTTARWNYAGGGGGAAHFGYAANSIFEFNSCGTRGGGGIGGYGGFVFAENCTIRSNSSAGGGGGAYVGAVLDSLIEYNSAGGNGGGGNTVYGTNIVVRYNVAGGTGGGMRSGAAEFSQIYCNVAGDNNGGAGAYSTSLRYCTVSNNAATNSVAPGGGGALSGGTAESCVFKDNSVKAGAVESWNSILRNCTVISTSTNAVIQWSNDKSKPVANVLFVGAQTNVADNTGAAWTNAAANYFTNTVTNGLFLPNDPPYRLPPGSPLIDAGNGDFSLFPLDLYGRARTYLGGVVDIGATEWTDTDLPISDDGAKKKRRFLALLFGKD